MLPKMYLGEFHGEVSYDDIRFPHCSISCGDGSVEAWNCRADMGLQTKEKKVKKAVASTGGAVASSGG